MPEPTPHRSDTPDAPDWNALRARALRDMPTLATPAQSGALEAAVFDLRRSLIDVLVQRYCPDSVSQEDMLRESLPPLDVTPGPFVAEASPWRAALAAAPGFMAGMAVVQGLAQAGEMTAGGLELAGGMVGVGMGLALAALVQRAAGTGTLPLPWGGVAWNRLRRWLRWGYIGIAAAALLRDFLAGRPFVQDMLVTCAAFFTQGDCLALWNNIYTALALAGLFAMGTHRPLRLDRTAFEERLMLAAHNWWAGASCAAAALVDASRRPGGDKQWRQVGRDLYSLAGELPQGRRQWLEDRLRLLGLEAPREEGPCIWSLDMRERYDPLGHLEPGDACYVDLPPLLENGKLLRKGTVRKVRQ